MIDIFIDPKNLLSQEDYEIELNQTHQVLQNIANTIERYRDASKKPVYKKLLNFYWNAMIFYEAMEDELEKNNDTKALASKIDAKGEEFAKKYEEYSKLYNPDELGKIAEYVNKKIELFKEIYDLNYVKILNNYQKILEAIESRDKTRGIKPLILKIISAEINNAEEGKRIEETLNLARELVNDFGKIDSDQNDEIKELTIPENEALKKIEEDISERLGKIELIDSNSIKLFNLVDDVQKDIIKEVNYFINKIKEDWQNDGALNAQEIKDIKIAYKKLINVLEQMHKLYHTQLIKNYKNNMESVNKFIDNFDIMYGIKNMVNEQRLKENPLITQKRFDFNENDLDKLISNESIKKQDINEYFNDPKNMGELSDALNILKGVI